MKRTRFVAVGACAIDTILRVPHFPEEDGKLRALSCTKRRGGNTPNTLEVLRQLIGFHRDECNGTTWTPELFLIATLPARKSSHTAFIDASINHTDTSDSNATLWGSLTESTSSSNPVVDISHCVYRENFTEPVSSYIIASASSSSRTIITHNELPEMTFEEFVDLSMPLLETSTVSNSPPIEQIWFHFEGRIPSTTLDCIRYLRNRCRTDADLSGIDLKISVELEKPGREGLQDLAHLADVVFYSRAWARGEGFTDAEHCLRNQAELLSRSDHEIKSRVLICPWGEHGAYAAMLEGQSGSSSGTEAGIVHSPAYIVPGKQIVDSTGAGDTFIAGVLYGLISREGQLSSSSSWSLKQTLAFANGLAGRKILQDGFCGLGDIAVNLQNSIASDRIS